MDGLGAAPEVPEAVQAILKAAPVPSVPTVAASGDEAALRAALTTVGIMSAGMAALTGLFYFSVAGESKKNLVKITGYSLVGLSGLSLLTSLAVAVGALTVPIPR
jgi:hypothetical protein